MSYWHSFLLWFEKVLVLCQKGIQNLKNSKNAIISVIFVWQICIVFILRRIQVVLDSSELGRSS